MYKVVINTKEVKKVIVSPLRLVMAEGSSPTIEDKLSKIKNKDELLLTNEVEGSISVYNWYKKELKVDKEKEEEQIYP